MRTHTVAVLIAGLALAVLSADAARACTSVMVTKGASADGSTFNTYNADSHELYGELYYYPPGVHKPGTMRDVIEWDTGKRLGEIPEAPVTYSVVGNMNERQVMIAETTFGGRKEVEGKIGVDYGSLIYIGLQRSRTAREAIQVMTSLAEEYGYASEGESFSLTDPNEAWIMEMVGKGPDVKGALWVARRIPDGYISAHANQARIRRFPLHDPDTLYAKDVITFAREKGWFNGKDEEFSFVDAYAKPGFEELRACEARVWAVFRRAAPSVKMSIDYVRGNPNAEPLPLWVKPDKKLSLADVMALMRDHFEGTEFDLSVGVGAGPYSLPYRWRPMTWKVDGVEYLNERAISTQQTGFALVGQSRASLPDPVGGVLWFSVDDTGSNVYVPMYCGIRRVPKPYAVGTADFQHFSWDSAFWVFNAVANFAYSRYSEMIVDVHRVRDELEGEFMLRQPDVDAAAAALYKQSPDLARDYLTDYSVRQGEKVVARWRTLFEQLMVKYLDGNVRDAQGNVTHPDYPESWRRRMAADGGDRIKVPAQPETATH